MKTKRETAQGASVVRYRDGALQPAEPDEVAAEEPLEIRVEGESIAVVMRTPGQDRELAAGFALTEGIVEKSTEIFEITSCVATETALGNVVEITLTNPASFSAAKFSRHIFSSSSCGICGKATIEAAMRQFPPIVDPPRIDPAMLLRLPAALRAAQETFERTGGLHACALFDLEGNLLLLREDVGRHNALDKLIGHELLARRFPLGNVVLLLSGRVSFEMTQKALAAGIATIAAISAPTSLAVEFAQANNQTLIGFLRGETMNVYAGSERLRSS